jgi:hypothetical protein
MLNDTSDSPVADTVTFELAKGRSYPTSAPVNMGDYNPHTMQHQFNVLETTMQPSLPNMYADVQGYQGGDYVDSPTHPDLAQYPTLPPTSLSTEPPKDHLIYSSQHIPQSAMSEASWISENNANNLANAFGDLKIGLNGQSMLSAKL